ncbi:methyltransferase domain-containing protein [Streptomyces sp. V1I1]|uniref:methyltransferase domain-containing protein n=1 Tax=Streptomyces sp. V1I1 TaxID=3042272 RepID=UPI0027841374|nr:methyltransferase domain-containing protein [Streptomyces sp. V1I1]MDQ0938394.1 ubiquinone/menaquinone biosynthesis C-methylase UbiE [Streptomyces sp. V1I1]
MAVNNYVLADLPKAEGERLRVQAEVWLEDVEVMLDAIGVDQGADCVDVGCGALGILEPLSRRVGPRGRVIGVDSDPSILAEADSFARERNLRNVELVLADASDTGLPRGSFDFVHCRFLLVFGHHDEIVCEMVALARPGGAVCCEETDQDSWNYFPTPRSWPYLKQLLERAFDTWGGDPNLARRLVSIVRDAGLSDVRVRSGVHAMQESHPYMRMPVLVLTGMRQVILDHGLVSAGDLDVMLADMEQAIADQNTWANSFTVAQVWGRKPSA